MSTDLSLRLPTPLTNTTPLTNPPATALTGAAKALADAKSPAAIAAQKFEGLMISTLLKQGLGSGGIDGESGLFGNGPGSDVYQGFLETYLSEHLAKSGGLGLAKTLERSLSGKTRA